ncbi:MAG: amidohydrolase [Desulfobulbaceae bacterium]|nr:amidohydrolase [Desulfobulbaceae bacterium]
MTDIRRHLHQFPELAFEEQQTADFISQKLDELKIAHQKNIAGTGIVATLGKKDKDAPTVALRADMDALPITEKTGLAFASKIPGKMHACGHDGHVAMLLGAAALLKQVKLNGCVKLIFQPAEEGTGGAQQMIAEGVLDGVDTIFAGHLDRHFEVNEIGIEPGIICAYTDEFRIEITSKGGHAAKPHETVDSIVVAGFLITSIQTLVSREVNPSFPSVITIGQINGGTAANIIADRVVLEGTIRTTDSESRKKLMTGLDRMVKSMDELYQAKTLIELTPGYPPVINDKWATAIACQAAEEVIGPDNIKPLPHPSLGGEDFSFFLQAVPGCLVRFGARKIDNHEAPAHSPYFDFNEKALPIGALFLAKTAVIALAHLKAGRK